jgi:hypothetical protein
MFTPTPLRFWTSTQYEAAPADAFQVNVGVLVLRVVPPTGATSVGAFGLVVGAGVGVGDGVGLGVGDGVGLTVPLSHFTSRIATRPDGERIAAAALQNRPARIQDAGIGRALGLGVDVEGGRYGDRQNGESTKRHAIARHLILSLARSVAPIMWKFSFVSLVQHNKQRLTNAT